MKRLADDVYQLKARLPVPNAINTFLVGDTLVDAGWRGDAQVILRELEGVPLGAHVLTHAHADHQGASRAVCERFGVPFWVHELDVPAAEDPAVMAQRMPPSFLTRGTQRFAGPGRPVDRALGEGDVVAGFEVLHVPGHSVGHIALWRADDRTLILGDVLNSQHPFLGYPGLREPPRVFTPDPETNRRSIRRVGELEPALVLFGHGPPVRDTRKFVDFCASVGSPGDS